MRPDAELIGWYYKRAGRRFGPLPIEEVARLLASGALAPSEMLLEIGEAEGESGVSVRYSYLDAASAVRARAARPAPAEGQGPA